MIYLPRIMIFFCSFIFLNLHATLLVQAEEACDLSMSDPISVVINADQVVRQNVPTNLFGFTLDWFQFQNGHYRNGEVRPETIKYLKPFKGAVYRYAGGNEFEWENAVGSIDKRKRIFANFEGMANPEFGPLEFFDFIKNVESKAVILVNVAGKRLKNGDQDAMIKDNLKYFKWLATNYPRCVGGADCPITYFELGNEVDWEKGLEWTGAYYSSRVRPLINKAKNLYPEIKFAVVGRTAPWGNSIQSKGGGFDSVVASELARNVDAVTFHPYYDGLPIPVMKSYSDKLVKEYQIFNPHVKVLVTEHGRWPSVPKTGKWENNWYQASGSGAALSTADFTLMTITDNSVAASMWHSLAVRGPWQLFHMDKSNDTIYPSAVYWSLRTLRESFLEDAVKVTPSLVHGKSYSGGYDLRLVAMRDKLRNVSLMGVNRDIKSKAVSMEINGVKFQKASVEVNFLQADEIGSDNTDFKPNKFQMETTSTTYSSDVTSIICIPPKSTFSILVKNK